ncbi:MAG: hypothetical protein QOD60_1340 [Solirubrobacterales bacterium]|nr:hypothetical protein [Solirubrobacterales bacterium]
MADPNISITRTFDAPRETVWKEWTMPEAFADWYGGTEAEVPVDSVEMDVREGGAWKAKMFAMDGKMEIDWHGAYQEVNEPERLAFTVSDRPGDVFDLITVTLTDLGDGRTEMVMEQSGDHMDEAGYARAKEGWGGFFDRMEERLAG